MSSSLTWSKHTERQPTTGIKNIIHFFSLFLFMIYQLNGRYNVRNWTCYDQQVAIKSRMNWRQNINVFFRNLLLFPIARFSKHRIKWRKKCIWNCLLNLCWISFSSWWLLFEWKKVCSYMEQHKILAFYGDLQTITGF